MYDECVMEQKKQKEAVDFTFQTNQTSERSSKMPNINEYETAII